MDRPPDTARAGRLAGQSAPPNDRVRQLSHDLRHCLYTIRTGIELLRQTDGDAARVEVLSLMENDQQVASRLIDELLALVRASHGGVSGGDRDGSPA